jgi:hypothetical protein
MMVWTSKFIMANSEPLGSTLTIVIRRSQVEVVGVSVVKGTLSKQSSNTQGSQRDGTNAGISQASSAVQA